MKSLARSTVSLAVAVCSLTASAATYYVKKTGSDETGDGSDANPYLTIQKAVDSAKGDGHTIIVGPGEYGESEGTRPGYGSDTCLTRLYIAKSIRIKSSNGPAATHIVGRHSTNANGLGEDAVRCVTFYFGNRSLLEGFTLRDGATWETASGESACRGGAVHCHGSQLNLWIRDCVISNCVARYGAVSQHGMFIHCRILDNHNPKGASIIRQSRLYGCLVQGNTGGAVIEKGRAVQCTFVDNQYMLNDAFIRNSVCVMNNTSFTPGTAVDFSVQDTADGAMLLKNPVFGDYRPVASSAAAAAGCEDGANGVMADATFEWYGPGTGYWTDETSPQGHGIDGRRFEVKDGACVAGAWAEAVAFTPAAEPLYFSGKQTIDGRLFKNRASVFPEAYPTSYYAKAVPAAGEHLYEYVNWKDGIGYERFPEMDEGIRVAPMAPGGSPITNSFVVASRVLWLDPALGDDDNAGTSSNAPIRTLQKIYDKRNGKTLAMCGPGTYGELGTSERPSVQWGCSNVANFTTARIRLKGYAGAEKTFIRGRLDERTMGETYLPGAGYAAMRGLCVQYPGQLQGFTVYNAGAGRTTTASTDNPSLGNANSEYGGVVYASLAQDEGYSGIFSVADCVISNCVALHGPAGAGIVLERCIVTNCTAGASLVRGGASRSLFVGNHFYPGNSMRSAASSWVMDCTVVDLDAALRPGSSGETSVNAIYLGGDAPASSSGDFHGCFYWNFTTELERDGLTCANPCLSGPSYRVGACSAAAKAFDHSVLDEIAGGYFRRVASDLDGLAPSFAVVGALNTVVPGICVSADNGGLSLDGMDIGFTAADDFESVTITRAAASRPCIGYTVNGATNLFDDVESRTLTSADLSAAGALAVDAIYTTDWYVNPDATAYSDANYGYTPKTAKLTLKGAMEANGLASGDTVHAAAGDYSSLAMLQESPRWSGIVPQVRSRVVVKAGVRLVGDEGRDRTFITGAGDFTADPERGFGPNAIRCAMLLNGASIKGFTLRDGRTDSFAESSYNDNTTGGGVLGHMVSTTTVLDCTVTNCAAFRGGAFRQLTAERCRVLDCYASCDSASVGGDVSLYNVFCDHNRGTYLVTVYYQVVNCTFGANNTRLGSATKAWAVASPGDSSARVSNVLSLIPSASTGIHRRSFFTEMKVACTQEDGAVVTNASAMVIDSAGRPVIGSNCGIDAGNPEYLTGGNAEVDLDGMQRVYNGQLDIGAYEADWRGVYARDITRSSRFSVDSASPDVVERAPGGVVRIPSGATLAAKWSGPRAGEYRLTVNVAAGGTLSITSNGTEVATVAGPVSGMTVKLASAAAEFPLEFACSGDSSYAEILNLCRDMGACMILR